MSGDDRFKNIIVSNGCAIHYLFYLFQSRNVWSWDHHCVTTIIIFFTTSFIMRIVIKNSLHNFLLNHKMPHVTHMLIWAFMNFKDCGVQIITCAAVWLINHFINSVWCFSNELIVSKSSPEHFRYLNGNECFSLEHILNIHATGEPEAGWMSWWTES